MPILTALDRRIQASYQNLALEFIEAASTIIKQTTADEEHAA